MSANQNETNEIIQRNFTAESKILTWVDVEYLSKKDWLKICERSYISTIYAKIVIFQKAFKIKNSICALKLEF